MRGRTLYFVKVYDIDTAGTWKLAQDGVLLSAVIPNDPTELARARRSLKHYGRYWLTLNTYLTLKGEMLAAR